jgi:orotate phosphoribosyltransferase
VHAAAVCLNRCHLLQEGEPQGRHVVIVDDLVQSGGTLIECHALLSSLGAAHGEPCCGTALQYIAAGHHGSFKHCSTYSVLHLGLLILEL